MPPPAIHSDERPWHLRRRDQAVVGAATTFLLAFLAVAWLWQGGLSGRLAEYDELPDREHAFRLDINAADWPELALLPGVGKTLAQRIIESREQHGPFRSLEEIGSVRGIGEKKLDQMRPHLLPLTAGE